MTTGKPLATLSGDVGLARSEIPDLPAAEFRDAVIRGVDRGGRVAATGSPLARAHAEVALER